MRTKSLLALFFLSLMISDVRAKEWRGITPLKSTRADVERLLGKANELGRYEFDDQRISIWYSEGPCADNSRGLAKVNCECLVAKDTVLRIGLTFEWPVKVSKLGIDKSKYERTSIYAYQPTATYSDFTQGVVYTIREGEDTVTNIDYLPSAKDCQDLVENQKPSAVLNAWQGFVPLRSTRADVERLLGASRSSLGEIYSYITPENKVDISYSADPCAVGGAHRLGSGVDVVMKIVVSPQKTILVKSLGLDKNRYSRIQNDHPENWVHYLNSAEGITVDAVLNDGCEEVLSFIYLPTSRDLELRCHRN